MSSQALAQTFLVPSATSVLAGLRALPRQQATPACAEGPSVFAGRASDKALAGLAVALVAGRTLLGANRRRRAGALSLHRRRAVLPPLRARGGEEQSDVHPATAEETEHEYLECMQGMWEDNVGLTIQVVGNQVHFNDGSGIWKISGDDSQVMVRGTRLLGVLPGTLHWETPNGGRWEWSRMSSLMLEDSDWVSDFIEYKTARVHLRRKLAVAVEAEAYDVASRLQKEWLEGTQFREDCTLEHQARLLAGKFYVPGTVVRFGANSTRGVIIGCEPWVSAAAARRIAKEPMTVEQRLRPLYHVLVDTRDAKGNEEGNATAFVLEHNIEVCEEEFPLRGQGVDQLMVPCHALRAYIPGGKLEVALKRQRDGLPLVLWQ